MQSQAELAKVLVQVLDQDTLTAVLSQLLGRPEIPLPPPPTAPIRSREFRRQLGNPSHGQWYRMRQAGKIPPGTKISAGIEIWTPEQVVETVARLAAEQRERDEGRAALTTPAPGSAGASGKTSGIDRKDPARAASSPRPWLPSTASTSEGDPHGHAKSAA